MLLRRYLARSPPFEAANFSSSRLAFAYEALEKKKTGLAWPSQAATTLTATALEQTGR